MKNILTVAAAVATALCAYLFAPFSAVDSFSVFAPACKDRWFELVNFSSNAFHMWQLDPLWCAAASSPQAAMVLALVVFTIGNALLLLKTSLDSPAASVGASIIISTVIAITFGQDTVVIHAIAWLPLTCLLAQEVMQQKLNARWTQLFYVLLLLVCAWRVMESAHQLTPLVLCFTLILARTLMPLETLLHSPRTHSMVLVALLLAGVAVVRSPAPEFPSYPRLAHVVADDNVAGVVQPLVGSGAPVAVIDRTTVKDLYFPLALTAFLAGIALAGVIRFRSVHTQKQLLSLAVMSTALSLLLLIDTWPSDKYALLGPLQALRRTIPGLFHFSLVPVVSACTLIMLLLTLCRHLCGVLAIATLACAVIAVRHNSGYLRPLMLEKKAAMLVDELAPLAQRETKGAHILRERITSPSANIVRERGLTVFSTPTQRVKQRFRSLRIHRPTLYASTQNDPRILKRTIDRRPSTRWSVSSSGQAGGEWLFFRLKEPVVVHGIEPSAGDFYTDFPRGLVVKAAPSCPADPPTTLENLTGYQTVFQEEPWQGAVHLTEQGYPYFGSQSNLRLFLDPPVTAQCFIIKQTGSSSYFDWSIAEIRIAAERR